MVSNSYLIVSFSDSNFGQLLTPYDVEGLTFVFPDVGDQVSRKDQGKGAENPVSRVEHVVEVQGTGNIKDKALENLIGDKHASINVAVALENGFVDEATKIFIE